MIYEKNGMAGNFEIDEHGLLKAQIGIRAIAGRGDRIRHLVTRAARNAAITMKVKAPNNSPHKSTGGFSRAIDHTRAEFRPGGVGGGGTWVALAGATRTADTVDASGHSYVTNVFQGTGLYGRRGSYIKAKPGNVMVIAGYKTRDWDRSKGRMHKGKTGIIFTKWTQGQRPQREWFDAGVDRANMLIASNLHRVFNVNDPMDDI